MGLVFLRRRRDGRTESMGAIGLAGREKLDNLIFVINCNLQRLMERTGDGKVIQELEANSAVPAGMSSKSFGVVLGPRAGRQRRPLEKH